MDLEKARIVSLIVFSPLIGAMLLALVPSRRILLIRSIAVLSGLLTFALAVLMLSNFEHWGEGFQFVEKVPWIPSLGVNYLVGVDGLSLWLIALTSLLSLLVFVAVSSTQDKPRAYVASFLILETGMLGTLVSLDGLLFYVFWELMLIPMYFIIGVWGGPRKIYAAIKFVLYTAFGSLLMLVAIIYLALQTKIQLGSVSFFLEDWETLSLGLKQELLLFAAFALAFAIKVPVFPLHAWLPDAHVEAPTGGSVILAGVLLKLGLYGLIRFGIPIFPLASVIAAPIFAVLGVAGIVYGALVAWVQPDIKKLVAYSSISHLGFCLLGYSVISLQGLQGAMLQMLNHGVSTGALFFLVGMLYERGHTRMVNDYGGVAKSMPVFSWALLLFVLSSIGLPLTNGFVGEFLVLIGSFERHHLLTAWAASGVILSAIYMLSLCRRVLFGVAKSEPNEPLSDLLPREKLIVFVLGILVFVVGLAPQIILRDLEPVAKKSVGILEAEIEQMDEGVGGSRFAAVTSEERPQ